MKKSMRLVSLLLVAVFFASVIPFGAMATTTALKNKTVLAFGDSLTALGNPTYVGYLSDLLGIEVINAGVGGNMTAHGRNRFQSDVLSKNPDVVLLCFGMNDQACSLPSGQSWTSLETYRIDLAYFITELKKIDCDVVLITPNPVCDETGYYVAPSEGTYTYNYPGMLDKFCTVMREVAVEYGCTLIDMNQEFKTLKATDLAKFKSYYASGDGIHQSQLGRQFWADRVNAHLNAIYDNVNKATVTVKCVDGNGNKISEYTYVGAKDANVAIAPPALTAFVTEDTTTAVKLTNGETVTFTYECVVDPLLAAVEDLDETEYSETTLKLIMSEYNKAKELLAADEIDFEALEKCAMLLEYYLSIKGKAAVVVSLGSSYTRPEPNYYKWDNATQAPSTELNEMYSDDYVRLTDGVKGTVPANSSAYSAWQSNAEIVIDLGAEKEANIFSGYFASGQWGVAIPADMKVSYSNDKTTWTAVEGELEKSAVVTGGTDEWSSTKYSVIVEEAIKARYIKFEITKTGSFVWVDEIEVASGSIENDVVADKLNLAFGKTYEKSPLFRQSNLTWDWDETFPEAYPDENGNSLTDGKVNVLNDLGDAAWVGFNGKTPILENNYNFIRVDLGDVYALNELALHVGSNGLAYGISAPNVEFFVSEDGETYTSVGSANGQNGGAAFEVLTVICDTNARFVEARITSGGWQFVAEIFAYGGAVSDEPVDPNPDDSSDPSEEPSSSEEPSTSEDPSTSEPEDPSTSEPEDPSTSEPEDPSSPLTFVLSDDETYYIVSDCDKDVTSVVIPETYKGLPVKEIGEAAFYTHKSLISVTIPASVTVIGNGAFSCCFNLKDLTIPNSVTSIGIDAFGACESLTSVNIPASVKSIGSRAFAGCSSLETITVDSGNTVYHSKNNCLIETNAKVLVAGCNNSVIPDDGSVTTIGNSAFANLYDLTGITIPDSVTLIRELAFSGCHSLKAITIPDSVTTIGRLAFYYCESLTSITIPDSVTVIGNEAFSDCKNLTDIYCEATSQPSGWNNTGSGWLGNCEATVHWRTDVEPDAVTGDINGNGEIDSMDYVLLKRAYFGTYKLKDISIGDINGNGEIDSMDYVYLRRAYFGTYVIK